MSINYYWKDGKVHEYPSRIYAQLVEKIGCLNCYIVDTEASAPTGRYGWFTASSKGWKHVPLDEFPAEFKAHLLLMGVI